MTPEDPRDTRDLRHAPWPGPLHWDWRCRVCDEPVADHPGLLARLRYAWRLWRAAR